MLGLLCLTPLRLADIVDNPRPPAPPRLPAADGRVTCIEPDTLARDQGLGGGFSATVETDHFLVAWKPGNDAVTEEAVATYVSALENSWSREIDDRGWLPPDQSDACLMTVLLAELDESWGDTGGYTDVVEDGGVPYMVLNTAWLEYGDDWTNTLVAHELNHASQFAYDVFWDRQDWWYWESTAEWVPDAFYDDANTYTWSLWAYLDAPWRALDSMAGTVQYGHFAFNVHLAETWDEDVPRAVWAAAGPGDDVRHAVEAATGEGFDAVVAGYSARVAAFDVDERDVWLEALGYFEMDPWTHVAALPASGTVTGRGAPQERGQNFLHFQVDTPEGVKFDFNGAPEVDGVETDWILAVAEVRAGGDVAYDWSRAADGSAALTFGAGAAEVYVAVVPFGEIGENGAEWSWSAEAATGDEPGDTGDTGDTDRPTSIVAKEPGPCGCSSSGGAALGAWALLGLVVARRRSITS